MNRHFSYIVMTLTALAAVLLVGDASRAEKRTRPEPEKAKKLSFPDFKEFETDNGMDVLVVEHREQPVVSIYVMFKVGTAADPAGKEGLASFTVDQINKGTADRDALALAEWIESVGGSVGSFATQDYSALTVSLLSEYIDVAYEYLQDVLLNATFPEKELDLFRKQMKTSLEFELSSPEAMARRHLRNLTYGDHPYAKQPTVESVEAISREDVAAFYERNFVANNVLMLVVGDVKWKDVRKSLKKYLGAWEPGAPDHVVYQAAPEPGKTAIYLYHKPGAVQTEIFVGHLAPKANDPDWPAMVVGNRVLGGGSDSRLFGNIRETKGWTYHVRTSFDRERDLGNFIARTPVRTEVTDSALVELLTEIERIKTEPVSQEELDNAKSYLIGNFPLTIETPDQIARQVAQYELMGLSKKDLETYRDRLGAVTVEDVQRVMGKQLHPERCYIVLVGDAMQVKEKVEPIAEVALFELSGEPLSLEAMAVEPVDYDYDTSMLGDMTATYALVVQSMNLGDVAVTMEKKSEGDSDIIAVSTSLAGMITLEEEMMFDAKDLSPISFRRKMAMGPQTMNSELAFTESKGSGTVQTMGSPEPKEVTFELVDGAILDGSVEYAMSCLPLVIDGSFRFPVVDSQSGTLQNVDASVLEVVDVETEAGNFKAFKIKVKRADGEAFMYLREDKPHIMIKQEVPSQGMEFVLKSLAH